MALVHRCCREDVGSRSLKVFLYHFHSMSTQHQGSLIIDERRMACSVQQPIWYMTSLSPEDARANMSRRSFIARKLDASGD